MVLSITDADFIDDVIGDIIDDVVWSRNVIQEPSLYTTDVHRCTKKRVFSFYFTEFRDRQLSRRACGKLRKNDNSIS